MFLMRCTLALVLSMHGALAMAAEPVLRVTLHTSDPAAPVEVRNSHRVQCPNGVYELTSWPWTGRLELAFDGSGGKTTTDLSGTPFGAALASHELMGYFGFTCGAGPNLNIQYWGMRLPQAGLAPQPMSYRITIAAAGRIVSDSGVTLEDIGMVRGILRPRSIPAQGPAGQP